MGNVCCKNCLGIISNENANEINKSIISVSNQGRQSILLSHSHNSINNVGNNKNVDDKKIINNIPENDLKKNEEFYNKENNLEKNSNKKINDINFEDIINENLNKGEEENNNDLRNNDIKNITNNINEDNNNINFTNKDNIETNNKNESNDLILPETNEEKKLYNNNAPIDDDSIDNEENDRNYDYINEEGEGN